jgi:hypothetical protein
MANKNLINQVIPAKVIADATTLLNQTLTLLEPYLIDGITAKQINEMVKLGEKSEPFVDKGLEYATNHPNTVPKRCNIPDAQKDFDVFEALRPIDPLVNRLAILVSHTRILSGSEAIDCINYYYNNVKQDAEDGVAEAIPIYNDLKVRYDKVGKYIRPDKNA